MSGYFGRGEAIGHAGEILQGGVRVGDATEPFLVTLPAPGFRSVATIQVAETWSIAPEWKTKALRAAQLTCAKWGVNEALQIVVESEIPIARGCGSSTADCVAAVRAVAELIGWPCDGQEIARLVQEAEGASDSTMFGLEPVAFLARSGELLRRFGEDWPAMHVAVVDLGGPAVETLACPVPPYTQAEVDEFASLVLELEACLGTGDAAWLGRIASRSGAIHQRYRPHANWQALREGAELAGAYGVALAHSGTVACVLSAQPVTLYGEPLAWRQVTSYGIGGREEAAHNADSACRGR